MSDDETPRAATGYRGKAAPAPVEPKVCRACREPASVLHHDPDQPTDCRRVICGACQGKANRRILDHINPVSQESRNGY